MSMEGSGRQERGEKLGVLKTIQMHARGKHIFAPASTTSATNDPVPLSESATADLARPVLVRRNSTSASDISDDLSPPPPIQTQSNPLPATDPSAPQSSTPPTPESLHDTSVHEKASELYRQLKYARDTRDTTRVLALVQNLRSTPIPPHTAEFNMALEALHETRKAGEPLNIMLDLYNEMIAKSVVPNTRTYLVLILALTDRDDEVYRAIMSLEVNVKREFRDETKLEGAQARIDMLRAENNFGSAMALFEAASAITWNRTMIPLTVYANLIRSCAQHSNVDAAIHVFAHLERKSDLPPSAVIYSNLILVYTNIGDLQGAKEVFNEYRNAVAQGRVAWSKSVTKGEMLAKTAHLSVWNKMIQAYFRCGDYVGALSLLEQMMDAPASEPSAEFKAEEMGVPAPSSSTFTKIIAGFIQGGDLPSALSWFNKLLERHSTVMHPRESSTFPPKPDQSAWTIMLDALASAENITELNRLFAIMVETAGEDGLGVTTTHRTVLFEANMHYLDTKNPDKTEALHTLDFLAKHLLGAEGGSEGVMRVYGMVQMRIANQVIDAYIKYGNPLKAFYVLSPLIVKRLEDLNHKEKFAYQKPPELHKSMMEIQDTVKGIAAHVLKPEFVRDLPVPFEDVLKVMRVLDMVNYLPEGAIAHHFLYAYALQKIRGELKELRMRDWELLALASTSLELPNDDSTAPMFHDHAGTASLLEDFKTFGVDLQRINKGVVKRIVHTLAHKHQPESLQEVFTRLGPEYEQILNAPENNLYAQQSPVQKGSPLVSEEAFSADSLSTTQDISVDQYHSRYVEQFFPNNIKVTPLMAYARFEEGVNKGIYPVPSTIGRLINALGRFKEMKKVRTLYNAAHLVMSTLEPGSHSRSAAWFQIEDQMIIACAHAGEMEAAFEHRARIAEQGGIPSADAFGALIECVKDTTDDTSNAMAVYQDSRTVGCTPNVYMFNTIISKLAKARKADFALELFQEMKATGVRPSSITYGAVVAACARVGDAASAEQLFIEMSSQRNFKPRIPPFNTMMQLYAHTKPDRERVIHYYNALLEAGIQPSAHTYKVCFISSGFYLLADQHGLSFSWMPTVRLNPLTCSRWKKFSTNLSTTTVFIFKVLTGHQSSTLTDAFKKISTRLLSCSNPSPRIQAPPVHQYLCPTRWLTRLWSTFWSLIVVWISFPDIWIASVLRAST